MNAITIFPSIIKLELFSSLPSCNSHPKLPVTNGAIVIHTQRLKSDPGGNLLS